MDMTNTVFSAKQAERFFSRLAWFFFDLIFVTFVFLVLLASCYDLEWQLRVSFAVAACPDVLLILQ